MNKALMFAMLTLSLAGCATEEGPPEQQAEETYTPTGTYIPRKQGGSMSGVKTADKEQMERAIQQSMANTSNGR